MAPKKLSETDVVSLATEIAPRLADAVASRIGIVLALGDDALLTAREAADFLNKSGSTLEAWRSQGSVRAGSRPAHAKSDTGSPI